MPIACTRIHLKQVLTYVLQLQKHMDVQMSYPALSTQKLNEESEKSAVTNDIR